MRIVSGICKGRAILPPKNFRARPTTDFAKENIFNVVSNYFDFSEVVVLDIFSGTGSISYEFASRGAQRVVSVELDALHQKFIRQTAEQLKLKAIDSVRANAFSYIKGCGEKFDIVFADPPYDLEGIDVLPELIFEHEVLKPEGWFIFEHSKKKDYSHLPHFREKRVYGSVNFSIFQA